MTDKPLIDISPENWNIVRSILQRYVPEREVWAFGSRVKWTAKEYSDLDIAIIGGEPLSIGLIAELELAFQDSALPFKVDVVDWATITATFRNVIEAKKVQIQTPRTVEGWTPKLVTDIADLNPSRSVKKGEVCPFVEMAALPVNGRDIPLQDVASRAFSGSGSRFKDGDVLLARITPCLENGKTALVNVLGPDVVGHGSTEFIVLSAKEPSDQRFIYYLARHPDFRDYAIQHMEGTSGRQRVSATSIGAYRLLCPPAAQRKEIGEVLGALDDRITLLRQSNATLEAIAQALFKSWFVDFDPVRAKAEGREPEGLPPEIAELFPSEFEESEFGEIPKGWKVRSIEEIIQRLSVGQKYDQKSALPIGSVPILDQGKSGLIGYHNNQPGVIASEDNPVCVFANHTCYMRLIYYPFSAIQNVLPFVGYGVSTVWVYYATLGKQPFVEYKGHWPDFVIRKIATPPHHLTEKYSQFVSSFLNRLWLNEKSIDDLVGLRDALLPRLMSGTLKIERESA